MKVTNAIFGRSIPAPYRQVPRTAVFGTLENVRMRSAHIHRNSKAAMKYVCDAYGGKTWFRIETEAEATAEADVMRHNVAKYFGQEKDKATRSFQPSSRIPFEQEIGLAAHIQREMPLFLTLRDGDGDHLVTAMLPPGGQERDGFSPIIVGVSNCDPYPEHGEAIRALGSHFGIKLDRARCYPYGGAATGRKSR
jgi:hypothetical protein